MNDFNNPETKILSADSFSAEHTAINSGSKWSRYLFGNPAQLWKRNLAAVLTMLLFLGVSHVINIAAYQDAASLEEAINLSGRQRMLSQRALYLASELQLGNISAKQSLIATIDLFKTSNAQLASASGFGSLGALPEEIHSYYWGDPQGTGLYYQSLNFVSDVESFAASTPPSSELWQKVNLYEQGPLLERLDKAVGLYEETAIAYTEKMLTIGRTNLIAGTFILLLMSFLIFYPSHIAIVSNFRNFKETNDKLRLQETVALKFAKRAERAASEAETVRDKALESERQKSEFLSTMGHEIRTPLNGVLGMLELLSNDELSPAQSKKIDIARYSATDLLRIINDILDFSRLEHGGLHITCSEFNVRDLANQAVELFRSNAEAKQNTIAVFVNENVPLFFTSDRVRVSQVLNNLTANAVKFTSQGRIEINVSYEISPSGSKLCFEVTDTGIGIKEEDLDRIFDRFLQIESDHSRGFGGSGLGLSICKKLVKLLNGKIECGSELGRGSSFRFWVSPGKSVLQSSHQSVSLIPKTKNLTVLVVEDNTTNQILMKGMLTKLGHKLTIAENGLEALKIVRQSGFDAILMDIQMPVMDGLEATRKIRETHPNKEDLPIYAVTANSDAIASIDLDDIGLNGYLAKPVSITTLRDILNFSSKKSA